MKGTFRIGGAAIFGVLMIFGAFLWRGGNTPQEPGFVVATAPERTSIRAVDGNGDGIEDWEEHFTIFETIATPASSSTSGEPAYEQPTTLTGRFSQAFFQDYLEGKMSGVDFSDPTSFAEHAAAAVESSARSRRHTRLEVTEIESTSELIRNYGNEIAGVMNEYSTRNENEIVILSRAMEAEDPGLLAPLAPIRKAYEDMALHGLQVPVPSLLIDEHLSLVNAFAAIAMDIGAMERAFIDPLYAITRTAEYREKDVHALYDALAGIAEKLRASNVSYGKDEFGASFYMFEK